jgi:hypothetical protein
MRDINMATTVFDDEIISSTDLKNNQKRWFDRAMKSPVSITNRGGRKLVLINRDQIHSLVQAKDYAEKILKYSLVLKVEMETGRYDGDIFPWAASLTREDRLAFRDELVAVFDRLIRADDWAPLDKVIDSWQATAEALTNRKFMEVVNSTPARRKYKEVE